jgi:hypothetical protein
MAAASYEDAEKEDPAVLVSATYNIQYGLSKPFSKKKIERLYATLPFSMHGHFGENSSSLPPHEWVCRR